MRVASGKPAGKVKLMPLARRRSQWWKRRWVKITGLTLLGLLLVLAGATAYYYPKAKTAVAAARHIKAIGEKLPTDFADQEFEAAKTHVQELHTQIAVAQDALGKMQGLRAWPYIGRQYNAGVSLLSVGDELTDAVDALVDFGIQLFEPFSGQGKVSLASITADEKGQLLAGISQHETSLREAQQAIERAETYLQEVPDRGLLPQLAEVVQPLKQQFPLLQQGIRQAIPATRILPAVLGYPDTKTYLFLLENNTELRPGGGFIGTYGVLRLNSGEILSLSTDNSYNLDEAAKNLPTVTPPEPISRYLKINNWYFRDANWSPDFPSSAQQALLLYKREGGRRDIDGVMAITPTLVVALLELVGPITVNGLTFTPENFTDQLQRFVDVGFQSVGLDESERKDIIGPMTSELVDRLLRLPVSEWGNLFLVLNEQLQQKQFLLYMEDDAVQGVLENLNWAGSIKTAEGSDYAMVVDANLASLKSDPVVLRTYDYQLVLTQNDAIATLKVLYNHTGEFDWKTTRYNTYVRVYVPQGAELIESSGAQLREKSNRAGEVTTTTELGKTVFAAFKSVEPGTQSELVLTYRLPADLAALLRQQPYQLTWQKQAGMTNASLRLNLELPQNVESTEGLDNLAKLRQDAVEFSGSLDQDRMIRITYSQ